MSAATTRHRTQGRGHGAAACSVDRIRKLEISAQRFRSGDLEDSPPYFHDGRLLTLEDAIELFNLVLELELSARAKPDLFAFLYTP